MAHAQAPAQRKSAAAKVTVLGECIDHHVKEEREELFSKAKKAKVDMAELGALIVQRKKELGD